jgi:hypothetical protein
MNRVPRKPRNPRNWKLKAEMDGLILQSRAFRTVATRALNVAEEQRVRARLETGSMLPNQIERIIKSARVSAETKQAVINWRKKENVPHPRPFNPDFLPATELRYAEAHHERTVILRRKLRALNLANGFLLGHDLHALEEKGGEPLPLGTVKDLAEHFAGELFDAEAFDAWMSKIDRSKHPRPIDISAQSKKISDLLDKARTPKFTEHLQAELSTLMARSGDSSRKYHVGTEK